MVKTKRIERSYPLELLWTSALWRIPETILPNFEVILQGKKLLKFISGNSKYHKESG